ncbi:MAG: ribosome assembly cofactor RimP [Muribaculaceae bacterium]|nr:ribosome assembly cofactor RimP [Muribaculaceae bacterium]
MIDKQKLTECVENAIAGTDMFLVDIRISKDNSITVDLDSMGGMDIDECAAVTRKIEAEFDRDVEDYELEVGSAGLTSPFRVKQQYEKNIGNPVEVLVKGGKKLTGTLTAVADDFSTFTVEVDEKVKEPGMKRPVIVKTPVTIPVADAKSVRYLIQFK